MASKTQRKPSKRSATKPTRVAVAPGNKKVSARKGAKAAKKAPAKKAAPRKAPPKKAAPKKAVKKAAPARKAAPKKAPVKKVAPPKKTAVKKTPPPKKAAPVKAAKKAAPVAPAKAVAKGPKPVPAPKSAPPVKATAPGKVAKPEKPQKPEKARKAALKEPAPSEVTPKGAARGAPPAVPAPGVEPELLGELPDGAIPEDEEGWAEAAAIVPPVLPAGPRKRGRKRRDPLDDLLSPDKPKRGRPGRPRKRSPLLEVVPPKRARLRKRLRARRSGDGEDFDLPVAPRPPAPRDTMSVEEIRADVLARYLRGETPSCPVGCGGLAQVVRVSTGENGAGEVWLECLSCAQRERFEVPAPTSQEREAVYATLEAGNEPLCPRHNGRWVQLRRRGRDLVCPECGILIAGR